MMMKKKKNGFTKGSRMEKFRIFRYYLQGKVNLRSEYVMKHQLTE